MKRLFIWFSVALMVCSCTNDATDDGASNVSNDKKTVESTYCSIAVAKDASGANHSLQRVWAVGDSITVVGPKTNKVYTSTGDIAAKYGTFVETNKYDALKSGSSKEFYAMAYGEFKVDPDIGLCCYSASEGTSVQKYGEQGDPTNLLFATSKDKKEFTFTSILGYLRVPISGDNIVKEIELINNGTTTIAGRYYFAVENPAELVWDREVARKKKIVLDCGEGVQLMDTPTDFYFAIRPLELKNGITLNIKFVDGSVYPYEYNKSLKITQNEVLSMVKFSTSSGTLQKVGVKFSGTTLWLPSFLGTGGLSGYINLGNGESKSLNSVERYNYESDQDHDITFHLRNATDMKMTNLEGITELDLSNF